MTDKKTRTEWQLFLPITAMCLMSVAHWYGLAIVVVWTGLGALVLAITNTRLSSYGYSRDRVGKIVLVAYHLFWWPWHIKTTNVNK